MRIVGGIFKGRTLLEFKGKDVRPTSDLARESLFNIIKSRVSGANFLDLFCGTGAVGIEALSRGAKRVVFNDLSKESISLTKKNLEKVDKEKVSNSLSVAFYNSLASSYLKTSTEKFDVVFIDAPYGSLDTMETIKLAKSVLNENGIIVFEDEKPLDILDASLEVYSVRKYGRANFTFIKQKKD